MWFNRWVWLSVRNFFLHFAHNHFTFLPPLSKILATPLNILWPMVWSFLATTNNHCNHVELAIAHTRMSLLKYLYVPIRCRICVATDKQSSLKRWPALNTLLLSKLKSARQLKDMKTFLSIHLRNLMAMNYTFIQSSKLPTGIISCSQLTAFLPCCQMLASTVV